MSTLGGVTLGLLGTLAALWILANLLARHLQGMLLLVSRRQTVASTGYDLLVLPGVVLHELAHLLLAVLLRVRILRADLFRFRRPGDPRQGEVIVERADPLRMSLIGAAPLIAGIPILLLLLRWLQVPPLDLSTASVDTLRAVLAQPWSIPRLYLLWAVANTMFPSSADRAAWPAVGIVAGAVAIVAIYSGYAPAIPSHMLDAIVDACRRLTNGLLPVVALDVLLLIALLGMEYIAERMTGRRLVRS